MCNEGCRGEEIRKGGWSGASRERNPELGGCTQGLNLPRSRKYRRSPGETMVPATGPGPAPGSRGWTGQTGLVASGVRKRSQSPREGPAPPPHLGAEAFTHPTQPGEVPPDLCMLHAQEPKELG